MSSFLSNAARRIENLRVSTKIIFSFAIVFACSVGFGELAMNRINGVDGAAADVRSHWLPRTQGLGNLLFLAQRFRVIEATLVMASMDDKAAEAKTLRGLRDQIATALKAQAALARDDGERAHLAAIADGWRKYLELDQQFIDFATMDGSNAAADMYRGGMRVTIHDFQDLLNKEVAANVASGDAAADQGTEIGAAARRDIVAMIGVAVIICTVVGYSLWRGVSRPIAALTGVMSELAKGRRDVTIPALDLDNEIGEMARAAKVFQDDSLARRDQLRFEADTQRAAADTEREQAAAERTRVNDELRRAMTGLGEALKRLAAGDLQSSLGDGFSSDYAGVREDLNKATERLREAMVAVGACADSIGAGVGQIASASGDLAQRTEQQASSLEETSAALQQVSSGARKNADAAAHAHDVVAAADQAAKKNAGVVTAAVAAMDAISKSATHISQIIGVIDEIAFQTNLLALNAGVEAARAGDAGKGFAVVASEVRALALRSAEAAKEIKTLISASGAQVKTGVKLVGETGAALAGVADQVSHIAGIVNQIATQAREQTTSLDSVADALGRMDLMTQQNAAMVEQSNAATQSLSREAERLTSLMGQFDVGRERRAAPSAPKPPVPLRPAAPTAKPVVAPVRTARRAASGGAVAVARNDWSEF